MSFDSIPPPPATDKEKTATTKGILTFVFGKMDDLKEEQRIYQGQNRTEELDSVRAVIAEEARTLGPDVMEKNNVHLAPTPGLLNALRSGSPDAERRETVGAAFDAVLGSAFNGLASDFPEVHREMRIAMIREVLETPEVAHEKTRIENGGNATGIRPVEEETRRAEASLDKIDADLDTAARKAYLTYFG